MKWNLHQLRQTVPHRIDRALRAILGSPSDYAVEARSGHSVGTRDRRVLKNRMQFLSRTLSTFRLKLASAKNGSG